MKKLGMTLAVSAALVATPAMARDEKAWQKASDIGAYGLTAIAIGYPLVTGDTNGALQAGGSLVATQAVVQGMKEAFPQTRPDRSDNKSFPSGHTATAFSAATTIFIREGQEMGIPALAVATFVGFARVQGRKHYWYDTFVGAAIGSGAALLITRRNPNKQMAIIPWGDTRSGGVSVAMRF